MNIRVGQGYDVHAFGKDRKLILGGIDVPYELGLAGHSDADVLVHAVMDAILGACALGDIGCHFPDNDPRYKGMSSLLLLEKVMELVQAKGASIINIDAVIMAQRPKLAPFIDLMAENIASAAGLAVDRIGIKATTTEKLGFVGRGEGVAAQAVCLVQLK